MQQASRIWPWGEKNPLKIFGSQSRHLSCTQSTPKSGVPPSQPLFSLTQTYSRTWDLLLSANSSQMVPKMEKKSKHNPIQLLSACAPLHWMCGGTSRVGSVSYHRRSGKTSPKIRENVLHRRRKRGAITVLHVGDAGFLKKLFELEFGKKKKSIKPDFWCSTVLQLWEHGQRPLLIHCYFKHLEKNKINK